jgi:hypothetical protein
MMAGTTKDNTRTATVTKLGPRQDTLVDVMVYRFFAAGYAL